MCGYRQFLKLGNIFSKFSVIFLNHPVSQASDSEGSLSVVVGGTVGGLTVIVFIIIVVLIVLIYIRRSHQKKSYPVKAGITSNIYDGKTIICTVNNY